MGKDREPTIKDIVEQASRRSEKNSEKEILSKNIFDSIATLFKERGDFSNPDGNKHQAKPLGRFPYLEYDSSLAPFYDIQISHKYDETFHSHSFLIEVSGDGEAGFKKLFLVKPERLEDTSGRVVDNMGDLRKSEAVIGKMLTYAYQHLPKPSR